MSFSDYLPWNWFGGESRLEQSQDLPPPHLDETDQSVLRDDDFSTSTPAPRTDRPTGSGQPSNPDGNQSTHTGPPPTHSEQRQSPHSGHHNLRSRANNPNAEEIRNTDNNDSEYSTEADQDQAGPRITVTSARTHLRNVKHICHEEFKRLSQVDFSKEINLEVLTSNQRRCHQLMADYQIAADQLHSFLRGKQLSDQKRTFKTSFANYLKVAKQLGARIKELQKPTTTSGQRMSTQEEPTRNVHFSVPSQSSSVPPNFNMPQQNVGQTQHQPHPVQRQPSIPQPGAQTTGLNPNEEKALRDLMSKAGLGMPGQSYGTRPLQNSGYSQGYLPYPQAPFVQPLYQPTQGYGQGFLPYQQAPIAQPHYLPPPGYGFNQLPVSQHQNMGTTNSFQDVSLSEAGQLRYDGRGMPKFEIENFKGDRLDYPRFKNTFMSIIGNRQIYAEEKALRLVNLLEGEPRKLIAGVLEGHIGQHTHAMIWDILDKFYGGQKRQMTNHIQKIANFIPIKNTSVEELKRFYILLTEIKSFFLTHNPTVLQHEFSTELGLVKQLVQERHQLGRTFAHCSTTCPGRSLKTFSSSSNFYPKTIWKNNTSNGRGC